MNRKYSVLFILAVLSVITFLDRNAISVAGQRITKDLGLDEAQFGWILSAFTIAYGVFEIPTGAWGDRIGAKKVLARIVIWWSVFTALTGMVSGFGALVAVRFLFGAGEAGAYPNTAIAIRQWFPMAERGRAQAIIFMASRLGGAFAPILVIPLQMALGWRATFYVLGGVGLIWVAVWWWWYRDPTPPSVPPKSMSNHPHFSWAKWTKQGNFWALMAMYYCYASGVFFFISWLPKYLQNGKGITEKDLMFSASLPFWFGAVGCLLGGWLSDIAVRKMGVLWGRRLVPLWGLILSGSCMLCIPMMSNNLIIIVLLSLGMAFMDVTAPVAWAVATDLGGEDSGAITGAMNTAGLLGGTITSLGIGYIVKYFSSYDIAVFTLAIQLIIGGFLWFFITNEDV